jgi:hypothetical protein
VCPRRDDLKTRARKRLEECENGTESMVVR